MSHPNLATSAPGPGSGARLAWLLSGVVLLLAAGVALSLDRLHERADEYRCVQTELVALEDATHELNALVLEAASLQSLNEDMISRWGKMQARINERFDRLGRQALSGPQLEAANKNYQTYVRLADQELKLIAAAKDSGVEGLDAGQVALAFRGLHASLRAAEADYAKLAGHMLDQIRVVSLLVLVSGVGFITLLFRHFSRKFRALAVAAAERRALVLANEQLESRVGERTADLTVLNQQMESRIVERTGELQQINLALQTEILERTRAANLLEQSEQRYRELVENARDLIFILASDGTFASVNSVVELISGLGRADWIGKPFTPLVHPADLPLAWEMFQCVMKGEPSPPYELRGHPGLPQPVSMEITLFARKDEHGKIIGVMGIGRDITERKRVEQALTASEHKYHRLYECIMDAIGSVTLSGQIQEVNPAFRQMVGYSDLELSQLTYEDLTPKKWHAFEARIVQEQVLPRGYSEVYEKEYRRKDGTVFPVELRTLSIKDEQGQSAGMWAIIRDLTARKQAEAALRQSEERFRVLLQNNSSVAVQSYGPDGTTLFWNQASERLYGYTAAEALGRNLLDLIIPPEMQEGVKLAMLQMARTGQAIPASELTLQRKDGTRVTVFSSHATVLIPGCAAEMFCMDIDLTERKRLEAQLFQSQKLETVGKLAGGIAHEFNSLLTAIIGQSELLLGEHPAGSPVAKGATEIGTAALRAATLTRQLLAYGRKQILRPEILDLNRIMAGMSGVLGHLMDGEMVAVKLVPAAGLHRVKVDAGQMEQVIMNLAMNARDAMPHGGKLTLETANVTFRPEGVGGYVDLPPGEYVMLAVSDTGTGMSEAVKARVFEPFFSTKGFGQATGMGLSTCYGIIKQTGGHISVYTELGQGTTFKIYLPQVAPPAKNPVARLHMPGLPGGTETILLVEDEPALREMAGGLLEQLGYTVLTAANGIEALDLSQQPEIDHIDLLFTDVVMPHLIGNELADRMRAMSPQTKILFTSGYTQQAIVQQGILDRGMALLQKPFTPSALACKVRQVLDQPLAPPAAAPPATTACTPSAGKK